MKKYIGIFLLSLTLCLTCKAQQSAFDAYKDSAISLGFAPYASAIQVFYDKGIHLSDFYKYDSIGMNLLDISHRISPELHKDILYADNVFVGTIVKIEYNNDTVARFHTTYTVQISTNLKGNQDSFAVIKQQSGPRGKGYVSFSFENEGFIGMNVLVFTTNLSSIIQKEHDYYSAQPEKERNLYMQLPSDYLSFSGKEQSIFDSFLLNKDIVYSPAGRINELNLDSIIALVHNYLSILNR